MDVYLIRHAQAGARQSGPHDKYRPLIDKGHLRAKVLVDMFADVAIGRVISSPATRCVQTVEPLAASKGLEVIEHDVLSEGSDIVDVLALLVEHAPAGLVACSHGDVIPELVDHLGGTGMPVSGHGCEKGSIWVLSHDGKRWTSGRKVSKRVDTLD